MTKTYLKIVKLRRKFIWSKWLRWGRIVHRVRYVKYKSWPVMDFGKLVESVERYQPHLCKCYILIEKKPSSKR